MGPASLLDLIDATSNDSAAVKSNGVRVGDVFGAVEAGEPWDELSRRFSLTPAEAVAAFAYEALGSANRPRLELLTGGSASPKWGRILSESAFAKLLPNLPATSRLALSAGLLQVVDLWDESHEAAQDAEDRGETFVSAYWHGIAHRREPDAGNATYWFRRVGPHPVFKPLAAAVQRLVESDPMIAGRLLPQGAWSPFAFIQLTTNVSPSFEMAAKRIQREECGLLLTASVAGKA